MSERITPISRIKLIQALRSYGWEGPDSHAKHEYMRKPGHRPISIPNPHGGKDIGGKLLRDILSQAGISREEWLQQGKKKKKKR